jgi:Ca2+-binding EF-hand superfamily protein
LASRTLARLTRLVAPRRVCVASQTLDPDNKGYVEAEKMRTLLTTNGERFSPEEIDDFLHYAVDAETGVLHYEDYVSNLM